MTTTLWSSEEFAKLEFPTPLYLVDPVIPQGGHVLLAAKAGTGKSQLVLTIAHAINHGYPLFGRWPVRQGNVVIVQADMTTQLQHSRFLKVITSTDFPRTFWVGEPDGSAPDINIKTLRVMKKDLYTMMVEADPILVVWDTLRKIHKLQENDSLSPVDVYQTASNLFPTATHLYPAHNRKEPLDPAYSKDTDEDIMGSVQWIGSCDTYIGLKQLGASPKRLQCAFHKLRTGPDFMKLPFVLEMDSETLLLNPIKAYNPHAKGDLVLTGAAARCEARRLGGMV